MNQITQYLKEREQQLLDNFSYSRNGHALLISEYAEDLLAFNKETIATTLRMVRDYAEELIQRERFSGAPYAVNEIIKEIQSLESSITSNESENI